MEALQIDQSESEHEDQGNSSSEESLLHISQYALAGSTTKRSIKLQGVVNGKQVLILVDLGSCGSFINTNAVEQLGLHTVKVDNVTVQVADGGKTIVNTAVTDLNWECQGHQFTNSFRVFNIPCYDVMLGMDWLDTCGKMWVDWPKKVMRFRHKWKRITLKGIKDKPRSCEPISAAELQQLAKQNVLAQLVRLCPISDDNSTADIPFEGEDVLKDYQQCFSTPKELPPHRSFDHRINMMPGVQPVNVKPYRYSS